MTATVELPLFWQQSPLHSGIRAVTILARLIFTHFGAFVSRLYFVVVVVFCLFVFFCIQIS